MNIKYKLLKSYAKTKKYFRGFRDRLEIADMTLTQLQVKGIKLWVLYLRNKDTKLYSSIATGDRQIKYDNTLLILRPGNEQDIMTIINLSDNVETCYEIGVPPKSSNYVREKFDIEMDRRMRATEHAKREIIQMSIDRLIDIEEKRNNITLAI